MLVLHKMWFDDWTSSLQPNVISENGKVLFREPKSKQLFLKKMQWDDGGFFFVFQSLMLKDNNPFLEKVATR